MKKILLSLIMISVMAGMIVTATRAYFTSSVALTGVTFSSGNANLKLTQIIMHQWFNPTVSYTGAWTTYASGKWDDQKWYPGLSMDEGFYLGNFSSAQIGLIPTLSLQNYTESIANMDNAFELRVHGSGYDSGWQTINWWRTNSFVLPNIAWVEAGPYATHGTYSGNMSLRMKTDADNSVADGTMGFDLHFDAAQAH